MLIETIHIFYFGEVHVSFQKDEENFNLVLENSYLSTLDNLVNHIWSIKPQDSNIDLETPYMTVLDNIVSHIWSLNPELSNKNLQTSNLSTLDVLVNHIYSLKPPYDQIDENFHRITIINDLFVQWVPKNLKKGFNLNIYNLDQNIYNNFIDDISSNIFF